MAKTKGAESYESIWSTYLSKTKSTPEAAVKRLIRKQNSIRDILLEVGLSEDGKQWAAYVFFKEVAKREGYEYGGMKTRWNKIKKEDS